MSKRCSASSATSSVSLVIISVFLVVQGGAVFGQLPLNPSNECLPWVVACYTPLIQYFHVDDILTFLPSPFNDPGLIDSICGDVYTEFSTCYAKNEEDIHAACSPLEVSILSGWKLGLDFICGQEQQHVFNLERGCLTATYTVEHLNICNNTLHEEISELRANINSYSDGEFLQEICVRLVEYERCVYWRMWFRCGEDAATWQINLHRRLLSIASALYQCPDLSNAVDKRRGLAWLLVGSRPPDTTLIRTVAHAEGPLDQWLYIIRDGKDLDFRVTPWDFKGFGPAVADYWNQLLIRVNPLQGQIEAVPFWRPTTSVPKIIYGALSPQIGGLALDWVSQNAYWTDIVDRRIRMASYHRKRSGYHRVVVMYGLVYPTALATHPNRGLLFWADSGRGVVERATLAGGDREVVASQAGSPSCLAVDYAADLLFWLDRHSQDIVSCTLDGSNRRLHHANGAVLSFVEVYGDYILAISQKEGSMMMYDKRDELVVAAYTSKDFDVVSTVTVAITAPERQPAYDSVCRVNNAECSDLCVTGVTGTHQCLCSYGYRLADDLAQCISEPLTEEFLLVVDPAARAIYQLSLTSGEPRAVTLSQGSRSMPLDADLDPVSLDIVWLEEGDERRIWRQTLDGSDRSRLYTFYRDNPVSVALDWLTGEVYYASRKLNPNVGHVGKLMTSGGQWTTDVIITGNDILPTEVVLDLVGRQLYWVDSLDGVANVSAAPSINSRISRVAMDDLSDRRPLVLDVVKPRGLTVDVEGGVLFWISGDSGSLEMSDLSGSGRRVLRPRSVGTNYQGLATDGSYLYITDNRRIKRYGRLTGRLDFFSSPEFQRPVSLTVHTTRRSPPVPPPPTQPATPPPTPTTTVATSPPTPPPTPPTTPTTTVATSPPKPPPTPPTTPTTTVATSPPTPPPTPPTTTTTTVATSPPTPPPTPPTTPATTVATSPPTPPPTPPTTPTTTVPTPAVTDPPTPPPQSSPATVTTRPTTTPIPTTAAPSVATATMATTPQSSAGPQTALVTTTVATPATTGTVITPMTTPVTTPVTTPMTTPVTTPPAPVTPSPPPTTTTPWDDTLGYSWSCDFEDDAVDPWCSMAQEAAGGDDFDWERLSGPTGSEMTGPEGAYTGLVYAYIEASNPRQPNETAILYTPSIPGAGTYCAEFYYNMYGYHINHLSLGVRNDVSMETLPLWERWGEQGNATDWFQAKVQFQGDLGDKVALLGARGEEYSGDIGVDSFSLKSGACDDD